MITSIKDGLSVEEMKEYLKRYWKESLRTLTEEEKEQQRIAGLQKAFETYKQNMEYWKSIGVFEEYKCELDLNTGSITCSFKSSNSMIPSNTPIENFPPDVLDKIINGDSK